MLIVVAVSILQISHSIRLMVDDLGASGELIINEVFEQVRVTLEASHADPVPTLQADRSLRTLIESSGAFAEGVVYVRIETPDGKVILSEPPQRATAPAPAPPFSMLEQRALSWLGLAQIYFAGGSTYEMSRTLEIGDQPFALIRVGLSTALTAAEVQSAVRHIAAMGAVVIGCATLTALLLGGVLLRPVAAITAELEQLAAGRGTKSLRIGGHDELSSLADKFNALSQRITNDRSQWEHERGQLFDAFRSITDAMILLDENGAILFANAEASGRLGLSAGGMAEGKPLRVLLGKEHPLSRMVEITFATGNHVRDVPLQLGDGDDSVRLLASIFSLGQGPEPAGLLIIVRDMKPVQELKRTLDYSGRLVRLSGLISGIGHQVRNPLNSMNIQLELLSGDIGERRPAVDRIDAIRAEVQRLDRVVDALMRFLHPQELRLSEVPVQALLQEITARTQRPGVQIEFDLDPRVPVIRADRDLLGEALTNIVGNAMEAMAERGGVLHWRTRLHHDGYVQIDISDNGPGISPEHLNQIFQLYFSTKPNGNGLGLALALRAIDLHQGIIDVQSELGKGTCVTLKLPIANIMSASPAELQSVK